MQILIPLPWETRSRWHKWKTKTTGMLMHSHLTRSSVHFYYYWCYDQQKDSQAMDREMTNSRALPSLFPHSRVSLSTGTDLHNQIHLAHSPVRRYWGCVKEMLFSGKFSQYTSLRKCYKMQSLKGLSPAVSRLESLGRETQSSQDNQTHSDFCTANKPWGRA